VAEDLDFKDKSGAIRLKLRRPRQVTVTKDYAWDGCTPKACLFDIVFGVPDGVVDSRTGQPKAYHASLVHDALYQFLRDGLPFTRRQADAFFLALLRETGFGPRRLYWLAVRAFGGLIVLQHRYKRKNRGTRHAVPAPA
jgi:hypothetical protein